ncbi:hypothetical protein HYO49_22800 [Vibrio parahaemolyticus]|nr:hypothetical protein [Vibrio parahaemolyticus]
MGFSFINGEIVAVVNFTAALFTIVAAFIALITLLTWKKQQRLGPKLNALLEAESHYNLVMQGYTKNFSFLFHSSKLAFETRYESKAIKKEANDVIVRESEKLNLEKIALNDSNFQLALLRLKRLGVFEDLDLSLDIKHLSEIFDSYLELIKTHDYSDNELNQELISMFSHEIHWIGMRGMRTFKRAHASL